MRTISKQLFLNRAIFIILFIIYPLCTLPYIFDCIFKRKKFAFTFLALFMGILAMLYPPSGDLYRYTLEAQEFYKMSFPDFLSSLEYKFDFILPFLSFFLGKLHIPFEFVRFLYVFGGYQIIFWIFNDISSKNENLKNKQLYIASFLLLFLCFNFTSFIFRFGFSITLIALAIYRLIYLNKSDGWIWAIIATLNHFSFIMFLLLMIPLKMGMFKLRKSLLIFFVLIAFIVSSFLDLILNFLPIPVDLVNHIMYYVDGAYAGEFLENHSLKYRIAMFFGYMIIYPSMLFFIWNYKITKYSSTVCMFLLLLTVASPFFVIFQRYANITVFMYLIYFLHDFTITKKTIFQFKVLLVLVIFSYLCAHYASRRQYSVSYESKVLTSSLPQLLSVTYTERWIDKNIGYEGEILSAE